MRVAPKGVESGAGSDVTTSPAAEIQQQPADLEPIISAIGKTPTTEYPVARKPHRPSSTSTSMKRTAFLFMWQRTRQRHNLETGADCETHLVAYRSLHDRY